MKLTQIPQIAFILVASFAVYAFVASARDGEARAACSALCALRPAYADTNRLAPDFELPALDGKRVSLASLRGKTVVLNFWTKTCKPCLEEMASLAELTKLVDNDVVVVTVTTDASAQDARQTMRAVLGQEPPFLVLVDPDAAVVADKFGTRLYPETWIIDAHGVIRARVDGARDWSNALVGELLRMVARGSGACGISFDAGKPRGPEREVCDDVGAGTMLVFVWCASTGAGVSFTLART